jgi:two-component system aerobic respiration control sensor histidine kinase ArcB
MTDKVAPTDPHQTPDPRDVLAMSLLGHDLRAALSEVVGGLRLVDMSALDPATHAQIARTRAAGDALALVLEQALAALLGDPAMDDGYVLPLQTARLLENIKLRWQGRARAQGLHFHLTAATDLPPLLHLDAALIERVLSNLLGNAFKFTGMGTINCLFTALPDHQLQISVQDSGPGFAEDCLPTLFTAYNRPSSADKPGSGLGLHIVHDMVVQAGGSIIARNRAMGGAEVVITLPLPPSGPVLADHSTAIPDLGHIRVLVADDHDISRMMMTRLLSQMGAEVASVTDGVAAVGRIERESFDLLVVDIEMPRLNGIDVIRHVRAMAGAVANLPIIAATAYRLRANKAAIEAAGADVIISKPILCPIALGEAVMQAMRLHQPPTSISSTPPRIEPAKFDQLIAMAGPEVAAELIERLHQDLRNAERGMLTASHGPVWSDIRSQTHVLMALSGIAGAPHLQELVEKMNQLAHDPTPDRGTFLTLLPQLLESLDTLIHFVSRQSISEGAAP